MVRLVTQCLALSFVGYVVSNVSTEVSTTHHLWNDDDHRSCIVGDIPGIERRIPD